MDSRGPVRSTHTSARQWRLDRDIVLHLGVLAWLQFLCCWFFGPVAESRAPQNALQICYNKCVGAIRNALLAGIERVDQRVQKDIYWQRKKLLLKEKKLYNKGM